MIKNYAQSTFNQTLGRDFQSKIEPTVSRIVLTLKQLTSGLLQFALKLTQE